MASVDSRSHLEGDELVLDVETFLTDFLPAALDANGVAAGRAAVRLGLRPLTLMVDGGPVSLVPAHDTLAVTRAPAEGISVSLDQATFSELVQDVLSTFGSQMLGRATIERGTVDEFIGWEPVLRCLLDGRPVYEPGSIEFLDRHSSALDLHHAFTLDDDPDDIGHFLAEAGYLHLAGVFTDDEMAAVAADHDAAMAAAQRDDGASWWARTREDGWYPARILGFNLKSPALREVLSSERFGRIGTFTDDRFEQRNPTVGDSAEGLYKKVGVVEGASDVSWHKDCSMGGHSRRCSGLTVGISVTGAGPENGELGVVAGSHRANVALLGVAAIDLPRIPLPTRTGDVTVHCSCTLHMSRPPVSAERRVVYSGFGLAARDGDRREVKSAEEIRSDRASLNDHVRRRQAEGTTPTGEDGFAL